MRAPLVIGGGPAGAAVAIHLARSGASPILLERSRAPHHKVCGDFLSGEAIEALHRLGLDPGALEPANINGVRLAHGKRVAEAELPFAALGLSRFALDEALLDLAAAKGAAIRRGCTARHLTAEGRLAVHVGPADGLSADVIFLATGKHDLRGARRPTRPGGPVGFKTYLGLAARQRIELGARVELVLFRGGYVGLQPVEQGRTALCVLAGEERVRAAGGSWPALLHSLTAESPHLAQRLDGATELLEQPVAVAGLPYGYLHRPSEADSPCLYRVGDQVAVIPSLTGDGVAIALASAGRAVAAWCAGSTAGEYHRAFRADHYRQLRLAMAAHRAACASSLQSLLVRTCSLWPSLMRFTATRTRCYQPSAGRALSFPEGI